MTDIKEQKEKLKSEAEILVFEEIPKILTQLIELINNNKFHLSLDEDFAKDVITENTGEKGLKNKTIDDLIEMVRPLLMQFDQNVKLIKVVLLLMVDEFKQGRDPYDRIVRLNAYDFDSADKFADRALEEIWKYFQSRSDIVLKIIDKPENEDLRTSLIELDLSFIHKLKLDLVQTRNYYIQLHSKFNTISKAINLALNPANNSLLSSKYLK
jgi:hypothetical protein